MTISAPIGDPAVKRPSLIALFLSFVRLGLTAFGGPAMIQYIGELAVTRKQWLDQETFKQGVALCQSIPGATAMQAAAYVGLKARGVPGALATFVGFGLPAFVLMMIFSALYVASQGLPWITALFSGLQVIVVALVANTTYTFGRANLKGYLYFGIAAASTGALALGISPFLVVMSAAAAGLVVLRPQAPSSGPGSARTAPPIAISHVIAILLMAGAALCVLYILDQKLFTLSLLMMKVDLFAFGGGFSALPLLLQEVVNVRGWMDFRTFMDGIALGQVTPGPIVITATFVGYLLHGSTGAVAATIAIFAPSFLMLTLGTLFMDRLKASRFFPGVMGAILASFVGLLLFVTIRFAIAVPWDLVRGLICAATLVALLRKVDIIWIVPAGAFLSLLLFR
jgi:chromate transporter